MEGPTIENFVMLQVYGETIKLCNILNVNFICLRTYPTP